MEVEKIFNDLESNQTYESDEARRKLVELFSQSKEQWLVHCMMDYFLKTGSRRIVEVLVKVQSPHDVYIFDRLSEWIKTQTHRLHSLNFFSFVVRKHPTWLFKVEKHRLIKDIIKLMLSEKEIVPLMTALLCIITLLPIIPNLVPNFLNDLFDVFAHLASWNSENPNRLPDDKLVHLQLGLQMLFHRLYGMYPCNFLAYLSDFIKKEKGAIFHHTIKPLLETVRVHPMLVTATTDSEVSNSRWKEIEPHDVVVECANLSLPVIHQDFNTDQTYQQLTASDVLDTPGGMRPTTGISNRRSTTTAATGHISYQYKEVQHRRGISSGPVPRFDGCGYNSGSANGVIWSPYNEIITSGPIPLTPTPSYMLPLTPVVATNVNTQLLGVTGSSPPEAAVEATPETTPMKDTKELKHSTVVTSGTVANPHAVRSIFASSQPSSPMRKEFNQFNFPDVSTDSVGPPTTVVEQETRVVTRITTTDRKLQQMLQDRTLSQSPFQTIEGQAAAAARQQGYVSPMDASSKCDTPELDSDMSSNLVNSTPRATPIPTPVEHITKTCDDCNETDRSMCTAGGLQIPTSRSMQLLAKGMKRRNRMASYCYNDSSCEKISAKNGISVSDVVVKVRRTKSCSSICAMSTFTTDDSPDDDDLDATLRAQQSDHRLQKSSKMLAIATTTKKLVTCANALSQTVDTVPQDYENTLYDLLCESKKIRNKRESGALHPQEILDQYLWRAIRSKDHFLDQEQFHLLCLQLQYERYRREIHAERNRRLMGRSRDKRSLEMERDRLREQLKSFAAKNKDLMNQIDETMKIANTRRELYREELATVKARYQYEIEQNRCLRQANDNLQTRLTEELAHRKDINYELEALRGQIFNLTTELQHAQSQVEIGMQCKQELARLEAEFIVMGEVQVKCRDRLAEVDNYRARDEELQMLQDTFNMELKDLKHTLEEKSSHLDSVRHKVSELHAQLVNNEKVITEQKRLLKTVKDEYEEKFKALNKKYEVQKTIIMQMEEKIMMSMHKPLAANATSACSPDTDKTDIASSMDRNSPLSTSLASSESLSASLRSTELRNLQQLVEAPPLPEASKSISVVGTGASIIEGTRLPALDLASSANTATAGVGVGMASAINIVSASTSSAAAALHNYDIIMPTISHTHPHLHLQQQQKQQPQQSKR